MFAPQDAVFKTARGEPKHGGGLLEDLLLLTDDAINDTISAS